MASPRDASRLVLARRVSALGLGMVLVGLFGRVLLTHPVESRQKERIQSLSSEYDQLTVDWQEALEAARQTKNWTEMDRLQQEMGRVSEQVRAETLILVGKRPWWWPEYLVLTGAGLGAIGFLLGIGPRRRQAGQPLRGRR